MKKILITHVQNTLNYGSAMMAINLIYGLKKLDPENKVKIYCECDEYHLKRLKIATGVNSLKKYSLPVEKSSNFFEKIDRFILGNSVIIKSIQNDFDRLIVLGGDDLAESNKIGAMKFGVIYYHINKKCKVILAGQSIGPFYGIYQKIASFLFRDITLVTRDDNSYEFSKHKLKIKSIFQSRDLALTSLPKQDFFNSIVVDKKLSKKEYILLVPSGLIHEYTQDKEKYFNAWKIMIEKLIDDNPNTTIVMLGHVLLPERVSDAVVIQNIYSMINDKKKENIMIITEELQPAEARALLGASHYVITGRMHAAVSSLYMNVPVVALAYSEKYNGVIKRGLNLPEFVVDCRKKEWGNDCEIIKDVMQKIDFIKNNYSFLKEKIAKNILDNTAMVDEQIKYISNKIG